MCHLMNNWCTHISLPLLAATLQIELYFFFFLLQPLISHYYYNLYMFCIWINNANNNNNTNSKIRSMLGGNHWISMSRQQQQWAQYQHIISNICKHTNIYSWAFRKRSQKNWTERIPLYSFAVKFYRHIVIWIWIIVIIMVMVSGAYTGNWYRQFFDRYEFSPFNFSPLDSEAYKFAMMIIIK